MIILNQDNQYVNVNRFDYVEIQTNGEKKRLAAIKIDPSTGNFSEEIPLFHYSDLAIFTAKANSYVIGIKAGIPILFFNE